MNYGNRNATSKQTSSDILKGYGAAVTSAVGVSMYLRKTFSPRINKLKGGSFFLANSMLQWAAVVVAGVLNITFMRMSEMQRGISL
jgi:hypothetical protein